MYSYKSIHVWMDKAKKFTIITEIVFSSKAVCDKQ